MYLANKYHQLTNAATSISRISEIKNRHADSIHKIPNVTGIGIGYKQTNDIIVVPRVLCIIVYVQEKVAVAELSDPKNMIPKYIENIPTDVREKKIDQTKFVNNIHTPNDD